MAFAPEFFDAIASAMTTNGRPSTKLVLITIPSSDRAFQQFVRGIAGESSEGPAALQRRLRKVFPRVVVRDRALSGSPVAWYVYRDGGWRPSAGELWWEAESVPRVVLSSDGWLVDANATAAGLLGVDPAEAHEHHFTDFIIPGTLDDALALFALVRDGRPLSATMLLRPISGDVIAVDLHAEQRGDDVVGAMRFADDVNVALQSSGVAPPPSLVTSPPTDAAFRAYALRAVGWMPEPTPDGLALRLHRVYPHAVVHADGDTWSAEREPVVPGHMDGEWWRDTELPRVSCDAQALILDANDAARQLLGRELVGHHWQEFVVPGASDAVAVMLEILRELGAAETRFRMPRADGTLVEFDSYTTVSGEEFTTVMKAIDG